MDAKKVVVTRMIDKLPESYKSFFDHAWATRLSKTAPAELKEVVDNLCLAWKEAANTHALPWLMMIQIEGFANGLLKDKQPEVARLIQQVNAWLTLNLKNVLSRAKMKELQALVKRFNQGLRIAKEHKDTRFPARQHWETLVESGEMQVSICGSQGLTYCGLVFAYEWFVVSCYQVLGGDAEEWPSSKDFWKCFVTLLGGKPKDTYWNDTPVRIARETRNCIAHSGGKVKKALWEKKPGYFVSNEGVLSIQPKDNSDLLEVLQGKVDLLVAQVAKQLAEQKPLGK